ncbi:MAG: DNA polymerase domain-containing protein [Lentisphaeria bacterium]
MPQSLTINQIVPSTLDRIVAIDQNKNGITFYQRQSLDKVSKIDITANYWILLNDKSLLASFPEPHQISELTGEQFFQFIAFFPSINAYEQAAKFLKTSTGFNPSATNAPYKFISDLDQQILISSSVRLFSAMTFSDTLRMQIDIEVKTSPGYSFPNAERENDAIIMIAMRDSSNWQQLLSLDEMSESQMLQKMVDLIIERDPDIIEGHNFFNFDLPYIETRAKRHKIKLKIGRDLSVAKARKSRFNVAERTIDYTRYDVNGRHLVDTLHLVQLYDSVTRELDGYGLKTVANYFGVAAPSRTYVEGDKITDIFNSDPELLKKYAMDDVHETAAISTILLPSYFYQTQLTPLTLQNCIVRGNATRIESIFIAQYVTKLHSIPLPEIPTPITGGLTESFHDGIFENIWHADVRSLYPSIIIAEQLNPSRDHLHVFLDFLGKLRTFRLEAKDLMRSADSQTQKDYYSALQSTFKILINSFYGYLGFAFGSFNDFALADRVTSTGRSILTSMHDRLNSLGCKIIEMDTDGLYFQPPENYQKSTSSMQSDIQKILPNGIEVELDSTYKAMFSYKAKNYALLFQDGRVALAGAALKSRGLEPFQRNFMREIIQLLLNQQINQIYPLYQSYSEKIANHCLPLSAFLKNETLSSSIKTYTEKIASGKGKRSAAYELASKANRDYRQGDQIKFYVTGIKKKVSVVENSKLYDPAIDERDENVAYYQNKLDELFAKFQKYCTAPTHQQQPSLF